MNKPFNWMTLVFLAAVLSCDDGSGGSTSAAGATSTDCPIGMFRPEGLADCVFPAERELGDPVTVSDNRCATGQPAFPPSCISDTGRRPYLSASRTCAPNYHFEMGVCQRAGEIGGSPGGGGFFGTAGTSAAGGFFGTNTAGDFGGAGSTGEGGATDTGGFTGGAGSGSGTTGSNDSGGSGTTGSNDSGGSGTTGSNAAAGQTGSDASMDAQPTN
jgi:hypothetical protein